MYIQKLWGSKQSFQRSFEDPYQILHPPKDYKQHYCVRFIICFYFNLMLKKQGLFGLFSFLIGSFCISALNAESISSTHLLRFPTTNGSAVVFSYAGQLYTVGIEGGIARRLTSGPGYAVFPRFSADGEKLAFTAQYDGNTEVYAIPASGGVPQRLTYTAALERDDLSDRMGPNNIVMAWKHTTDEVIFRSRMHSFDPFVGELFSVKLEGDIPEKLPFSHGSWLSYSPDDQKIAFNQVFREFRTWKRYRGGMADDIWIFDFKTKSLSNITENEAQDVFPMWAPNNCIYFVSDRDGRMNLFSYDLKTGSTTQHTHFKDFDIKFPSIGGDGLICFENAGEIFVFDTSKNDFHKLPIQVLDDQVLARKKWASVEDEMSGISIAPDGKRVVTTARGEVFTVPVKYGPTRNLTQTPGVHERDAVWSPDGKWIACISDATGENELMLYPQNGIGEPVQVTSGFKSYFYQVEWSPDSSKLLWGDRSQHLYYVDIASKEVTQVDTNPSWEMRDYSWSPDSKWIAYAVEQSRRVTRIKLYSLEQKQSWFATDEWYDANSPTFSDSGEFLVFASSRDFRPIYSETEWNHAYQNMERVYLLALSKTTQSPFAPKSDEVEVVQKTKSDSDKDKEDASEAKVPFVKVDFDGIFNRVIGLPLKPSNYGNPQLLGSKVYYLRNTRETEEDSWDEIKGRIEFSVFDLEKLEETVFGNYQDFRISANGEKILLKKDKEWAVMDIPEGSEIEWEDPISLAGLETWIDYRAEWKQIFDEAWRQMRDFFYAPNMHGIDWQAEHDKYARLLPDVADRHDLNYLLGELIGELSIGHAYVGDGDRHMIDKIATGQLGAELSRDTASGYYRIDKILQGQNWDDALHSPLTEIGVDVSEGNYILAVNGHPTPGMDNIYRELVGTVDKQVTLKISDRRDGSDARDVVVVPIEDESSLYYYTWVKHNTDYVAEKTDGQVGYIHIPDMDIEGLNEFVKHFYPQLTKKALIIDDRGNGGGNVSPQIIERLRRQLALVEVTRDGQPAPDPVDTFTGPSVLLLNQYSASDGDIFPYRYRFYRLGKLIGKRSWGGVVGIRDSLPFIDGGTLYKPEFASLTPDGSAWAIEGHGVDPDIEVDNNPYLEYLGEDQQLDKAIEVILEELKTGKYPELPSIPAYPVK